MATRRKIEPEGENPALKHGPREIRSRVWERQVPWILIAIWLVLMAIGISMRWW